MYMCMCMYMHMYMYMCMYIRAMNALRERYTLSLTWRSADIGASLGQVRDTALFLIPYDTPAGSSGLRFGRSHTVPFSLTQSKNLRAVTVAQL